MGVKLVFQDDRGNPLYKYGIPYDGLAPLPVQNEGVCLPDGQQLTVVGRQLAYVESGGGQPEVHVIFTCEREKRPAGGTKKGRVT
jgi:hypothetical protein